MGKWTLTCPNEGVYRGECHYSKKGKGFNLHCPKGLKTIRAPKGDSCESENPKVHDNPRKYLPHGLTKCEKRFGSVRKKLGRCIKKVEKRENCYPPYRGCRVNPVAVCRASIKCPP